MTLVTIGFCSTVLCREMTFFTLGSGMHTDERKFRQVMVERYIAVPAIFVMTAVAFLALLALVYVIISVTVKAAGFQFVFV